MKTFRSNLSSWLKRSAPTPTLGPRELDVLDALWQHDAVTAQQLHGIEKLQHVSLNTIQSTLERLRGKGLAERTKQGRAFYYRPTLTRAELISRVLKDLARDIGQGDLAPIISGFAEFVAADDPEMGKELLKLLDTPRRERD